VDGKASLKVAWLRHVNHLNFGGHNHIPGTADRLRRCQLSSPVSVINVWRSEAMLITSTVEICIQHLGRVEEMVFAARRGLGSGNSVRLSVRPSVRLSHVYFVTNPKNLPAIFLYHMKGNPSSQMWFFVQLCRSWQDFNWLKASRGPSAIAELLVRFSPDRATQHWSRWVTIGVGRLCAKFHLDQWILLGLLPHRSSAMLRWGKRPNRIVLS